MNVPVSRAQTVKAARRSLNPRFLELIILPTERCNFRCAYCYEDFKIGRMKTDVIDSIKKLINTRIGDLDALKIAWFGGEPLIAYDVVENLTRYAFERCQEDGVRFFGDMTTNAYLLDTKRLAELAGLGIRSYQISIDGLEEKHDITRKLANGNGTFHKIWDNLLKAAESDIDFEFILRLHITRQNIVDVEETYSRIKSVFGNDKRFRIFLKAIENLGGAGNAYESVPDKEEADRIQLRFEALASHSVTLDDTYICYAARPNAFVIRADGRVGKCTVVLNSDSNDLGRLSSDGGLDIDVDKLRLWMGGYASLDQAALTCPAFALKTW